MSEGGLVLIGQKAEVYVGLLRVYEAVYQANKHDMPTKFLY